MPDGEVGEGWVFKNYNWRNHFGNIVWAKYIYPQFKQKHETTFGKSATKLGIESKIARDFLTPETVEKEYQKMIQENGDDSKL